MKYHPRHVASAFGILYSSAVAVYAIEERHTIGDSAWWAFMTLTTVGYGDEYPTSPVGRLAGILLVASAVFVIIPAMTAWTMTRFMHDEHEWTHDEQEEVKAHLRELVDWKRDLKKVQ